MQKILCFGDSNTYGYIPKTGKRYDKDTRWSGILKTKLSGKYEVIEAGCNNRNGFIDSIDGVEFTGYKVLPKYLEEKPDIVILAIGINDVQKFYKPTPDIIKCGLELMCKNILKTGAKLILIAPPVLNNDVLKSNFSFQFDEQSIETSKVLPDIYKLTATELNCGYIDINEYTKVSSDDGLHYLPDSHKIIADTIYNYIINL